MLFSTPLYSEMVHGILPCIFLPLFFNLFTMLYCTIFQHTSFDLTTNASLHLISLLFKFTPWYFTSLFFTLFHAFHSAHFTSSDFITLHLSSLYLIVPHLTLPDFTAPHPSSHHFTLSYFTSPHLTSSHLTSPHLTSPHLTSPHLTWLHLTSSYLTSIISPHLTSPHLNSSYLTSPHLTSHDLTSLMLPGTSPRLTLYYFTVLQLASPPLVALLCFVLLHFTSVYHPLFLSVQSTTTLSDSDSDIDWREPLKKTVYYERRNHKRIPRSSRPNIDRRLEKASNGYHNILRNRKHHEPSQEPSHFLSETNDNLMSSLKDINHELSRIWSYMTNAYRRAEGPNSAQLRPSSIR